MSKNYGPIFSYYNIWNKDFNLSYKTLYDYYVDDVKKFMDKNANELYKFFSDKEVNDRVSAFWKKNKKKIIKNKVLQKKYDKALKKYETHFYICLKEPNFLSKEIRHKLFTYSGKLREYSDKLSEHLVYIHDKYNHALFGPNDKIETIQSLIRKMHQTPIDDIWIKKDDKSEEFQHIEMLKSMNKITTVVNYWFPQIYECIVSGNKMSLIDQVRDKDVFYSRIHRMIGLDKFKIMEVYENSIKTAEKRYKNEFQQAPELLNDLHNVEYDPECGESPFKVLFDAQDSILNTPISRWLNTYMKVTNGNQIVYNFPVPLAKWIYTKVLTQDKFDNDEELNVCDMSMGWGGRLAGILSAQNSQPSTYKSIVDGEGKDVDCSIYDKHGRKLIRYYGTDVNKDIKDGYSRFYSFYKDNCGDNLNFELYTSTLPAEKILSDQTFNSMRGKFNLMFTSPPYFNKELYSDDPNQSYLKYPQYDRWRDGFLEPMLQNVYDLLKVGGECWINIGDIKKGTIRKAFLDGKEYTGKILKADKHKYTYEVVKEYYPIEQDTIDKAKKAGFKHIKTYRMIFGIIVGTRRADKTSLTKNDMPMNGKLYKWEPIFVFEK